MRKVYALSWTALMASALSLEVTATQSTQLPSNPQTQVSPVLKTWARTYGTASPHEGIFDMRLSSDGGIRVAGYSEPPGGGAGAGLLMNLELDDGAVRSQDIVVNTLGGPVDGVGLAADGGALFTGRIVIDIFHKHDAWVVRVDGQGAPLWQRGFTVPGNGRFSILDAVELNSGAWIIAGATSVLDEPPQAAYLVRLSAAGTVDWQYEYLGGISEHVQSITATADGGVAIAGWTNSSGAGMEDAMVMKLDEFGAIQWQMTYGGLQTDQANWIVELSDGGFAVAGRTNSFTQSGNAPWVLRLDAVGNLLWHRIADGVWGDLYSIAETGGGGVLALGRVGEAGFQTNDLWALELGPGGSPLWQRAYEGDSGDWGACALSLSGSSFLLGGVWGWGFPEGDLFVVRTAADGELPSCDIDRITAFNLISPPLAGRRGTASRAQGVATNRVFGFRSLESDASFTQRCR